MIKKNYKKFRYAIFFYCLSIVCVLMLIQAIYDNTIWRELIPILIGLIFLTIFFFIREKNMMEVDEYVGFAR